MTRNFNFSIETNYINSNWSEVIEIQFDDDISEVEIEKKVGEIYTDWLFEKNQGGWYAVT